MYYQESLYFLHLPIRLCICLIYVNYFGIIIFVFVAINHIISLIQTNLFFGYVCQEFSLRVLLNFRLNFCQFQPGVAYKSVAYIRKACIYVRRISILNLSKYGKQQILGRNFPKKIYFKKLHIKILISI